MKRLADFIEKAVVESLKDSIDKTIECRFNRMEDFNKLNIDRQLFTQTNIESVKPAGNFFILLEKDIAKLMVEKELTDESLEDLMFQFSFDFSARYDEITEAQMGWQVSSVSVDAAIDDSINKDEYLFMEYDIAVGEQKGKLLWVIPKQFATEITEKLPDDQQNQAGDDNTDNIVEQSSASPENLVDAVAEPMNYETNQDYGNMRNLDILMDIKLKVVVRIGQKTMFLKDVLKLIPGSKVIFEQEIDDPVDILVNGKVIAKGKVVSVDGFFGIKITSIESMHSRLNKLR